MVPREGPNYERYEKGDVAEAAAVSQARATPVPLGAAGTYVVLYEGTGSHNLQITNVTINGIQTVNESAGLLDTVNGVAYRIFNVTSYTENDGNLLTINCDGSGDPVVFNFGFNSNVNLGGDVALTGGLTDDQVLWNFIILLFQICRRSEAKRANKSRCL